MSNLITRNFIASLCCTFFSMAPVWADDTEIFFGDFSGGETSPNVLFIVDTSGSMDEEVGNTGKDRLEHVQEAMTTILNGLYDVNVGIMRFSNPGGPVLYKVDYIDRNVNDPEEAVFVYVPVLDADDDAQQVTGTGQMVINDVRLEMNTMEVGAETLTSRVSQSNHDAEEDFSDGGVNTSSGSFELTYDDSNTDKNVAAVKFADLALPANATITNAYVTFRARIADVGGLAEVVITGEANESGNFNSGDNGNITSRARTTAVVAWDLDLSLAGEETILTPDLSAIVQEIIGSTDAPLWSGSASTDQNDLVIIFEPEATGTALGRYDFYAYDQSSAKAPLLTVEYYVGAPPGSEHSTTGLRFQDVFVPKNAVITSASIDFTAVQADAGQVTDLVIYGEDNSDPLAFSTSNKIDSRTKTSASAAWSPLTWDTADNVYPTSELAAIVQELVNRTDWCGGDDMAFIIDGDAGGLRMAYSRDANNGKQPLLNIQYEADSLVRGETCIEATVSKRIVEGKDDVEEDGNTIRRNSDNLEFDGSTSVGLRFTNMNLPEDAPIKYAYLEFDPYNSWNGTGTYVIEVEDTGDAAEFAQVNGMVDDRAWRSTSVTWTETEDWDSQVNVRSVDIKTLLQQVVDDTDWSLGNDIAFRIRKTSGSTREAESYDYDPVSAPLLVVVFEDDGTELDIRLVRDDLLEVVSTLNHQGYTPIQDTLYEAALYYTGGEVDYGAYRGGPNDRGPHAYTRVSADNSMVAGSFRKTQPGGCSLDNLGSSNCKTERIEDKNGSTPATYKSPIDDWCQVNNHIILLTDGAANRPHSDAKIETFIDGSCDNSGLSRTGEYCVKDLVSFMYETDQSDLRENQKITTHTIGFNFSSSWLADVATAGGGQYKEATEAADLVDEIEKILTAVLKTNSSFVAPVAAINQFNRLNHRSEIYFAVFRPDETPTWPGNLKKYRLRSTDNEVLDFSSDAGAVAINPDTGFFTDAAQSAWGGVEDGKEVDISGANSQLPLYSARNVYTHYTGSSSAVLSNSANVVSTSNAALTKAMFGVTGLSDAEFDELIEWVLGKDVDDNDNDSVTAENRFVLGDPLHSKPIAVTYGGTEANPDITVFFGTNTGFLHAVDSETGVEQFAFMPEALTAQQALSRANSVSQEHLYGIDGSVTPWVHDPGANGINDTVDFVYIYVGMRRGGRNYYALDVTDRDNPEVLWTIKGGEGDFTELGDTWSQPTLGNIDIDGTDTTVLYFAGGYDSDQDDTLVRATDDVGRALFIVNAETGALIWSGGNGVSYTEDYDDMLYSIPADLSVVDVTSTGQDNIIFVGDMGGQVWRFDIHNGAAIDDLITGGVIADLGVASGTNDEIRNRRFYHGPDVALIHTDEATKLAVTIGSGFHAHPLAVGTLDRFYMIEQGNAFSAPSTYVKLTEASLYDATDNDVGEGVDGAAVLLAAKQGWYFDMPRAGEKVLSTPLTFKNTVTFTSYEPNSNSVTSNCMPAAGVTRVYQVNLEDSSPTNDWDDVTGLTEDDRSVTLQSSSIIDEPVIICTGAGCDMFVGAEKPPVNTPNSDRIVKTYWRKDN
jgi:type IV pilus assembly protein PilY1